MPKGTLYDDTYFATSSLPSDRYVSAIVSVGDTGTPIRNSYTLSLKVGKDTLANKRQYCMVRLSGKSCTAVGGTYKNGKISAKVNRFGRYAITTDQKAPTITPITLKSWGKKRNISYKAYDNLSGISSYRCEIDGRWILLEHDGKTGRFNYKLEASRIAKGKRHTAIFTVTDACGNASTSRETFYW